MPAKPAIINDPKPDLIVCGAGIVGLWGALKAVEAGLSVTIIEAKAPGAGASGGVVGALMPHQPGGWSAKKALQLEGLMSLPGEIAALEAATGLSAGYARTGRVMPIWSEAEKARHATWAAGAEAHWPKGLSWEAEAAMPPAQWLAPNCAPFGVARDSLAGRLEPRAMVRLLACALEGRAQFRLGAGVARISEDCSVLLDDRGRIRSGHVLIATGINAFQHTEPFVRRTIGVGVKGQAALLRPLAPFKPAELPVIYADGLYIIAHANGTVAVGSTSENSYSSPDATDELLDGVIARALDVCPLIRNADILERWAGVRPKHESRDPVVVPLPGAPRVIAALGAFKIGFGIAHLMASEAVGHVTGRAGPWRDVLAAGWRD
jgi:glycine/D-amino acid oxidase-like deaminating enzyme